MVVKCVFFRSMTRSWAELLGETAEFASRVPREDLIDISHSENHKNGVVAVWFWGEETGGEHMYGSQKVQKEDTGKQVALRNCVVQ